MTFDAAPATGIEAAVFADARLVRFLDAIGSEAAAHVSRLAPAWITRYPAWEITGGFRRDDGRPVAYVDVRSPFWHLPEFGASTTPMTPYLRPGALAAINNRGGRLKESAT